MTPIYVTVDLQIWLPAMALVFAIGIYIGGMLNAHRWAENAKNPMRMLYRGKFYKVTLPDEEDF